jgi:hypothetical protein
MDGSGEAVHCRELRGQSNGCTTPHVTVIDLWASKMERWKSSGKGKGGAYQFLLQRGVYFVHMDSV